MKRIAKCHPERPHCAHGKCRSCYWKARWLEPEFQARRKAYNRQYQLDTTADPAANQARRDRQKHYRDTARANGTR